MIGGEVAQRSNAECLDPYLRLDKLKFQDKENNGRL